MTVTEFLNTAEQYNNKSIAVVCNSDKFSGTFKMPKVPPKSIIEIYDVTHYHNNYINDYPQHSIPIETITAIYIE